MSLESPGILEALGANFTLERPFPSVNMNMPFQNMEHTEALQANFAGERSLTTMNPLMILEIGRCREVFGANLAAERSQNLGPYVMPLGILPVFDPL